jgi:hypothetical protein
MFRTVQESKTRLQDRSLKLVRHSLRASSGRPLLLIRSSRRSNIFGQFAEIQPGNPHIILYKGGSEFLDNLEPATRSAYTTIRIEGEGFLGAGDAANLPLDRLRGAVVVFDVPNGNLPRNENLLQFARALQPRQIVALLGDRFEVMPVQSRSVDTAVENMRLEDPEMEPVYLGIDPNLTVGALSGNPVSALQ